MLGELISRVGAGGVQLIIETHSDHILNGVRLAVKHQVISKEAIELSFFIKIRRNSIVINVFILKFYQMVVWIVARRIF